MPDKSKAAPQQQLGTINISPNTIAMIAGIASMRCFGVVGMASRNLQDGISELLTGRDNLTKGIEVIIDEDQVRVDLHIIVEYGIRIQEVARNVIENVKYAIKNQLGLEIIEANVIIQSVRSNKK